MNQSLANQGSTQVNQIPDFMSLAGAGGVMREMQTRGLIQATAVNNREFTVRQDFMPEIGDYLRREAPMWSRLLKVPAPADLVQEIRQTALPTAGFTDKQNLTTAPQQPTGAARNRNALDDPGQLVKAMSGYIDWSHYARSLAQQQGAVYGDQVAKDTADMIAAAARQLELSVWAGNAAVNPLSFNGISVQRPAANLHTLDLTDPAETRTLGNMLVEVVSRIGTSRTKMRKVSNIFTTGAGLNLVHREVEAKRLFTEISEVTPGLNIPGIRTIDGVVPIEVTRYLDDTAGAKDIIRYYFLDMDMLSWQGVVPMGGTDTFDPQIFEVTQYQSAVPLTESRMVLCYGTLYAMDRGNGISVLEVTVPAGTAWTVV